MRRQGYVRRAALHNGGRFARGVRFIGSGIELGSDCEILGGTTIETLSGAHESITLGHRVRIKASTWLCSYGGRIEVGEGVLIGHGSVILGHGGVTIGPGAMLSPYVVVVASDHAYWGLGRLAERGFTREPIVIGSDVWLGSHTVVTAGAHIGEGVVVGANSVVTGRLEPYGLYVGAPAKRLRDIRDPAPREEAVHLW